VDNIPDDQMYPVPNLIDVDVPASESKRIVSTSVDSTEAWLTDISLDVVAKLLQVRSLPPKYQSNQNI